MGFTDRLEPEVTTIALCWRVARVDGVVLGFTSHDQMIEIDGLRYEASPGMTPSALSAGLGLDVTTMEFAGGLSAAAITDADLAAGRFDGARLNVVMVDWTDAAAGTLPVARGTLGAVDRQLGRGGGSFTATVRSPTAAFDALVVESCSPTCRAELGDSRCRVDLAPLTTIVEAQGEAAGGAIVVSGVTAVDAYLDGRIRCLEGANAGLDGRIAGFAEGAILLLEQLPYRVAAATRIELRQGCDKRLATCATRFANAINFRGEPHVPGTDVLTRFPGV